MIFDKLQNFIRFVSKHGLSQGFDRAFHGRKIDVISNCSYVLAEPLEADPSYGVVAEKTLNWIVPSFPKGSGGHINIYRFIQGLEKRGYFSRIIFSDHAWMGGREDVRNKIIMDFGPSNVEVYLTLEEAPPAMACIATGFSTAFYAKRFKSASRYFYFIQDYEPLFFGAGSYSLFAQQSYGLGLVGITAGDWLAEKLRAEYGMSTHSFGFSYDKDIYYCRPRKVEEKKRVFFYARPETQRRAFELGMLVLNELCKKRQDVEVLFAGGSIDQYIVPFPHKSLGKVDVKDLGGIYNSCDVALVISMTNLSLLPLELMACGTPVVSNTGPWVEWLLSSENCKLSEPKIFSLVSALEEVLYDPSEWNRLHTAGRDFAASTSWDTEVEKMATALAAHGC